MKKVIYISIFPSTGQIERYLFIQDVIDAGFKVEYWDLSGIYFKDFPFKNTVSAPYIRKVPSFHELRASLRKENLKEAIFVVQVNFEWRVLSLFILLSQFKCKTAFFALVPQVSSQSVSKVIDKIKKSLFSKDFLKKFLNLMAKASKRAGLIKEYDLVFAIGESSPGMASKVVGINYLDYDRYQLSKDNPGRMIAYEYCAFLDEGSIYNEDVKILKMGHLDPQVFYQELNQFFDAIERQFNLKVVIAAHPGIKYDKEIFQGRGCYEGKTCDLVKDCRFVISQSSFSVSFAVLFKKPVMFIYTEEYANNRKNSLSAIRVLSDLLGLIPFNISPTENLDKIQMPPVDLNLYERYKYIYLTSKESEDKLSKDIVIRSLRDNG